MDLMLEAISLGDVFYMLFYRAFDKSETIEFFTTNLETMKR